MTLNDAATKDLTASSQLMMMGSSPKMLYTAFLLGLVREYFSLIMQADVGSGQIDRGFTALVAFAPDKDTRERIHASYTDKCKAGMEHEHAAVMCIGDLVDYLSSALDLVESSEGSYL